LRIVAWPIKALALSSELFPTFGESSALTAGFSPAPDPTTAFPWPPQTLVV